MLSKAVNFIRSLLSRKPVRLVVVRRYQDANGSYVGELYMDTERGCEMIGASLDNLPVEMEDLHATPDLLDTEHDFLDPFPAPQIRVGSLTPEDNDRVRHMVGKLPRGRMTVSVRNRFIEPVTERKNA